MPFEKDKEKDNVTNHALLHHEQFLYDVTFPSCQGMMLPRLLPSYGKGRQKKRFWGKHSYKRPTSHIQNI